MHVICILGPTDNKLIHFFADQFEALCDELWQWRDECLELQAVLALRDVMPTEGWPGWVDMFGCFIDLFETLHEDLYQHRDEYLELRALLALHIIHWGMARLSWQVCGWFTGQFEALREELYQRRDECLELRALLASRDASQMADVNPLMELGSEDAVELKMAYNSQRDLKRLQN